MTVTFVGLMLGGIFIICYLFYQCMATSHVPSAQTVSDRHRPLVPMADHRQSYMKSFESTFRSYTRVWVASNYWRAPLLYQLLGFGWDHWWSDAKTEAWWSEAEARGLEAEAEAKFLGLEAEAYNPHYKYILSASF